jgi:hypothetical protein
MHHRSWRCHRARRVGWCDFTGPRPSTALDDCSHHCSRLRPVRRIENASAGAHRTLQNCLILPLSPGLLTIRNDAIDEANCVASESSHLDHHSTPNPGRIHKNTGQIVHRRRHSTACALTHRPLLQCRVRVVYIDSAAAAIAVCRDSESSSPA